VVYISQIQVPSYTVCIYICIYVSSAHISDSEFDKMRKELSDEIPANVETLPSLPPKTCFRAVDEVGGAVYALYRN